MTEDDIEYYRERAMVERGRAKTAPSEEIALVHERLASLYEKLVSETSAEDRAPSSRPPAHTFLQDH